MTPSTGLRSSGGIYHDMLKYMVARIAEGFGYQSVEMEARGEATDDKFIPDVVMRHFKAPKGSKIKRKPRVYVEIQDKTTHHWMDKIEKNYKKSELIIIDVHEYNPRYKNMNPDARSAMFYVHGVYTQLMHRINDDTQLPPQKKKAAWGDEIIQYRGHRIKRKNKKRIDHIENRKREKERSR